MGQGCRILGVNPIGDADAVYDDVVEIDGASIAPTLSWGITGQSIGVDELYHWVNRRIDEAYEYMDVSLRLQ